MYRTNPFPQRALTKQPEFQNAPFPNVWKQQELGMNIDALRPSRQAPQPTSHESLPTRHDELKEAAKMSKKELREWFREQVKALESESDES